MADDFDDAGWGEPVGDEVESEPSDEIEEEVDELEIEAGGEEEAPDTINRVPDNERVTYNKLTKYEKTAIISARAEQIARGAKIYITVPKDIIDPIEIAKMELDERKTPFIIRRMRGKKKYEEFKVSELIF